MGKSKSSRKGKKAWRTNISTQDIEDFYEKSSKDALSGGSLTGVPSDSLFFVDKSRDLSVKRKIDKCREKILRVDSILQKNSFVQPIPSSNTKKSKQRQKEIQRAHNSSQKYGTTDTGMVDIWNDEGEHVVKKRKVSNKAIIIPAVEVEPPGCSYNPSSESHQDSLAHAVADEMQKVYTKELRPAPVPLTVVGEAVDEEDMYFLDADSESDGDVGDKEADLNDDADIEKRPFKTKRVTRVQLNKRARNKEKLKMEAEAKKMKEFSKDLHSLPDIINEIAKEDEEKSKRHIRREIAKQERLKSFPPRLGRHNFFEMASKNARKDPAWKYGEEHEVPGDGGKKGYKYIKCKFCCNIIKGVKRMKEHLACTHKDAVPCPKVPTEVKDEIIQYLKQFQENKFSAQRNFEENVASGAYYSSATSVSSSRGVRGPMDRWCAGSSVDGEAGSLPSEKMTPVTAKEHQNQVCMDIGRFFYENGIPFNVANSPSFTSMLCSVGNFGRGLKPPTMHDLRSWILDKEVETTKEIVNDIKTTWKTTGVSLLSDGWSDMRSRSLINFLVNNQYGTVFLRTVDASDCIKNAQKIFELLDEVVEEIGEDIVVQVVTDNASAYKAAGALLMEKRKSLYWTPCAAHCIDLMLEKIGEVPQHKNALIKAKKVSNFIYNHQWVLSLTRKYLNKDLLRPAATRFATTFLTIQSIYEAKDRLQQMFVSTEWGTCAWAKKTDGKEVKKIIMDERNFWPSVVYCMKTAMPLVEVLRIVDGEQTPAMGFIYGAMDECKEKIAKNLDNNISSYKEIWDIIDQKWEFQMHRDLHAAAYYLNPQYRWSPNVSEHPEIKRGLYDVMERLVKDTSVYLKIEDQLIIYKEKRGLFGYRGSLATYKTRPPVTWWGEYGDETPELKAFAIKVLGLTCSASACERNWSTFNQVHTKRRNRLNTGRMNKLVYIMYNRKLKQKFMKRANLKEDDDPLLVENVLSDDEWIADPIGGDEDDIGDDMVGGEEGSSRAVRPPRGAGAIREGGQSSSRKRKAVQTTLIDEDEDVELNVVDEVNMVEVDSKDDELDSDRFII